MPLFSVIIPTYNRAHLIGATIDSVLAQTWSDFEVVVMDDGSTDDTAQVMARYTDPRLRYLRQANRGEGAARNAAIRAATGRYMALLDSDDLWFPWTLATYERVIREHREPAFIAGTDLPFRDPAELAAVTAAPLATTTARDFLSRDASDGWIPPCATAVRADAIRATGGFVERKINYADADMWLQLGAAQGFVRISAPVCAARRWHAGNVSHNAAMNVTGVLALLERERQGAYPGGEARRRDRLEIVARHARPVAVACLRHGHQRLAWSVYRAYLATHAGMGRAKFLLAFPLLSAWAAVRGRPRAGPTPGAPAGLKRQSA